MSTQAPSPILGHKTPMVIRFSINNLLYLIVNFNFNVDPIN